MSSATLGSSKGSAFRARRFGTWSLRRLASRYGELPLHALPGAIPATDSAAAPARAASERTSPPRPRPDPEYESRLEQLAQSMLGAAAKPDPALHAVESAGESPLGKASANTGANTGVIVGAGNESDAQAAVRPARAHARAPEREAVSGPTRESIDRTSRPARPASGGRAALDDVPARAPARRPVSVAPVDFGPDGHGRREPVLDPLTVSNSGPGLTPPPSRRLRNSAIAVAMLTGIAIGIGSAWWFAELDEMDRALASAGFSRGATDIPRPTTQGSAAATAEQLAGLAPPSERPARNQDTPGAPQDSAAETPDMPATPGAASTPATPAAAPKVVSPAPAAVTSLADQDGVPDSNSTGTASAEVSKPAVASVDARPARDKSRDKNKETGKEASKDRDRPRAQDNKRSASQVASAKRSKKPAPVARATPDKSDEELDRLRSQAYSESSRDREQRVLPKPASPATAVAVTPISTAGAEGRVSHKKELAQCEKLDGLFPRERCKWRICKDEWGSNGCPSFAQQAVRF